MGKKIAHPIHAPDVPVTNLTMSNTHHIHPMKTRNIVTTVAVIGLFTVTPVLQLQAQSRTSSAIEELTKAETARHPAALLGEAKVYLEISTQVLNQTEREDAENAIEAAIRDADKGDRHNMLRNIKLALHEINGALGLEGD